MGLRRKHFVWCSAGIACLAAFIAANVTAGWSGTNTEAIRLATLEAQNRGWQVTGTPSVNILDHIVGRTAIISFSTPPRSPQMWTTLEVTLRKPLNLMNWQLIDFRESSVVE